MPYFSEQRTLLRSLAIGGVLVGSLAAAGPASAALGGAGQASFDTRPNLQSVTFNGVIASFNFDKTIQAGPNFDEDAFRVGGYNASTTNTEPSSQNVNIGGNGTSVLVTMNGDEGVDFPVATFGTVQPGALRGVGTQTGLNLADSTHVTGAEGENGTRGFTSGPDLQSATIDSDNNYITFTFDQDVDGDEDAGDEPDEDNFGFVDELGNDQEGDEVIDVDGPQVIVRYDNPPEDVDDAKQAFVDNDNAPLISALDTLVPGAPRVNVPITGKEDDTLTLAPTLVSAEINQTSGTITWLFDQQIATNGNTLTGLRGVFSDGTITNPATSAVVLPDGRSVRTTYGTSQRLEHEVFASAGDNAVESINGGVDSIPSGKPIGGNVGAKATGYTTAPDAIQATINAEQGQVTVLFDSRLNDIIGFPLVDAENFDLLTGNGTVVPGPEGAATAETSTGPSQTRVLLQYTPAQLALTDAIRVGGNSIINPNGGDDSAFNTDTGQINVENQAGVQDPDPGASVFGTIDPFGGPNARNVETILVPEVSAEVFGG